MTSPLSTHTNPPPPTSSDHPADVLAALVGDVTDELDALFAQMEWAEDEIVGAMHRHGEPPPERHEAGSAGPIYRAFTLLKPTHARMATEFVYRAHCRELLDRVAAGDDTRPPTSAEMAIGLMVASLATPLHGAATGLYMRVFSRAFPTQAREVFDDLLAVDDYERMYGSQIDDHESFVRRKLRQTWRALPPQRSQGKAAGVHPAA